MVEITTISPSADASTIKNSDEESQDTVIIRLPRSLLEEHQKRGDFIVTVAFTGTTAHTPCIPNASTNSESDEPNTKRTTVTIQPALSDQAPALSIQNTPAAAPAAPTSKLPQASATFDTKTKAAAQPGPSPTSVLLAQNIPTGPGASNQPPDQTSPAAPSTFISKPKYKCYKFVECTCEPKCPYKGVRINSELHQFLEAKNVNPSWWDRHGTVTIYKGTIDYTWVVIAFAFLCFAVWFANEKL